MYIVREQERGTRRPRRMMTNSNAVVRGRRGRIVKFLRRNHAFSSVFIKRRDWAIPTIYKTSELGNSHPWVTQNIGIGQFRRLVTSEK